MNLLLCIPHMILLRVSLLIHTVMAIFAVQDLWILHNQLWDISVQHLLAFPSSSTSCGRQRRTWLPTPKSLLSTCIHWDILPRHHPYNLTYSLLLVLMLECTKFSAQLVGQPMDAWTCAQLQRYYSKHNSAWTLNEAYLEQQYCITSPYSELEIVLNVIIGTACLEYQNQHP